MDNKDKQALIDGTATIPYKLHILNNDGTIKDTLTEEDIISTDYEDYRYVNSSSLCIGQFVARKLKGEVKILDKDLQIEDKEISVEMGINRNDGSKVYDITIDGKSVQETRSGKNLLKNILTSQEINGVTITKYDDGSFLLNGTSTIEFYPSLTDNFTIESGTYTLSSGEAEMSNEKIKMVFRQAAQNVIIEQLMNGTSVTFNNTYTEEVFIFIVIRKGQTFNNVLIKPMLEKGDTKTDYEPYGVSPSPDYPSEIKTVKGVSNLFDKDNANILNCYVNNNGVISSQTATSIYIPIIGGKTYTITRNGSARLRAITTDVLPSNGVSKIDIINNDPASSITISTSTNSKYLVVYFYLTSDKNDKTIEETMATIQIEEGSILHDYVPYGSWLKVKDTGKNLFYTPYTENNKLTKTATKTDDYVITDYYIELEAGKEYTFSCKTTGTFGDNNKQTQCFLILNKTFGTVINMYYKNGFTFTPTISGKYYLRYDVNISGETHSFWEFQIEEGSTATEYKPYQEQSTLIDMNKYDEDGNITGYYELSSIGDIKDTLTIQNGKANINQKIDKISSYNGETITTTYISTTGELTTGATVYYELAEPQTISLGKYNKIEHIDDTEHITIQTNISTTFTKELHDLVNWYNLGNFLITKPTDDDVKDTLTFDSMDYTKKFNKSFDSSGINFPCTALQLAKYCCEECGVELATTEFLNYDFEVIDNQYTNEDTFRNVMQDIGKLAYSWIRIGWDNKCYIDFNYGKEVDEYNKINNDNYYDLELQQKTFGPVNRVIIGMSDVEGENVYIEDEESIAEYGVTELQIYDNNLTYTPELRNKVIDSAKVLFGLTYTPMALNTTGHPWLLGNEKVEVTGMDNTIYYMYPWDRTITYSGHIKSKLDSKGETKTETEYKYKGDIENVLKKTRIIVNKQEGTITSLTQTTTTIQDNLQQNYYDKTQTNRLIQTSGEGITNTFSEAGGNNIFRNTGLWFEDSSTSYYIYPKSDLYPSNQIFTNGQRAYEFWDGLVLKEYYDKAANLTSLLLQNGYFEQKQQVPNGNYTVSFKYKKLIESATTKVIINNVEYDLTNLEDTEFRTGEQDSDGNYITQPLEVTDGYIFVRFYTNIKNSTIIYDLMVNAGSVKLAYSQNQNETTTDTVNISKGITITSSNTDTTFKANSDGIRTLNKNNETLSEFTDKGMKNKQIEVTDEATIVQVLWQNVGDQTWLTRL